MEVSMSITRRGKYTDSNICINVQVRNVVCLFFLLYANLLVLVTLCEGNHYPFIEERYNNVTTLAIPKNKVLNPNRFIRPQCSKILAIVLFPNIFYFLVGILPVFVT